MKSIAFTFDDGPNNTVTPQIIDLFEQYGGKCTFFLIGQNINEESAKVSERAVRLGYELENHSFTHRAMPELTDAEKKREIKKTDDLIGKITGSLTEFFRPPYIAYDDNCFKITEKTFICGKGCDDWNEEVPIDKRIEEILAFADDGVIVLLHDSHDNQKTVEALRIVLPRLKELGFDFVTLKELFNRKNKVIKPYPGEIFSQL